VPNKFAVLGAGNHVRNRVDEPFVEASGYGAHEVVIESPEHSLSLSEQPLPHVEGVLMAIRERFLDLMADPRIRSILVFKNHGEAAGTSLRHPHWQIVATPVVPRMHRLRHNVAQDYFDKTNRCLYCDLLDAEMARGTGVISTNESFAAIAPFASHVPYQVRILPRRHASAFSTIADAEISRLAGILQRILHALRIGLGDPPFNLILNTAPIGDEAKRYFLWHLDILPRLSTPAGFEMGSGMSVNSVLPEEAAERLRTAFSPVPSGGLKAGPEGP
jgi:UDPglucose--hexose-1-phosphate uridylyltransferase